MFVQNWIQLNKHALCFLVIFSCKALNCFVGGALGSEAKRRNEMTTNRLEITFGLKMLTSWAWNSLKRVKWLPPAIVIYCKGNHRLSITSISEGGVTARRDGRRVRQTNFSVVMRVKCTYGSWQIQPVGEGSPLPPFAMKFIRRVEWVKFAPQVKFA